MRSEKLAVCITQLRNYDLGSFSLFLRLRLFFTSLIRVLSFFLFLFSVFMICTLFARYRECLTLYLWIISKIPHQSTNWEVTPSPSAFLHFVFNIFLSLFLLSFFRWLRIRTSFQEPVTSLTARATVFSLKTSKMSFAIWGQLDS